MVQDKRTKILESAISIISEKGFHDSPISIIAEKAGVGVGSMYRYFKDKDDLIYNIFKYYAKKSGKEIIRGRNEQAPIRQQFILLLSNTVHYFINNKTEFMFLIQYLNSRYGAVIRREAIIASEEGGKEVDHPLIQVLRQGKAQEYIKDLPFPVLISITLGVMEAIGRDIHFGIMEIDEDIIEKSIIACWDAIKM